MRIIPTRSLSLALTACTLVPSLLLAQTPPVQPPAQRPAQRQLPRPLLAPNAPSVRGGGPDARGGLGLEARGPGARGPDARRGEGRLHPAAMLLRARTQLELSDDQVKRLEALAAAPAPKSNASDMMRARADLLDATQGDGNLAGARAALDKLSRLRNDQLLARIKTQQEVRAVLTPTQRAKVDNMRRQLRNRVGANRQRGMRPGGMRPGGMRQGGMRQGGMRQGRRQMGPGMMPGNPQGPQGPMPRMRRGGDLPDSAPPVPPTD